MHRNSNVEALMEQFRFHGLTFDDITLVTRYADFLPDETDISSRLTTRLPINIPFVSAAMDTVTEAAMAIAMALEGGIGVIHKNLTIEQQAKQVGVVKHHLHGLIRDPITFRASDTLDKVAERKRAKGYKFNGFPILDDEDRLVGILTATDLKYAKNKHALVADVMTRNVITAPPETTLEEAYKIMLENRIGKLPLVQNGKLVGLYSFTDVCTLVENVQPQYNRDAKYRLRVGAAVGPRDYERVEALVGEEVDVIVVDSAHGHSRDVINMVRWISSHYPDVDIIAGNICTGEAAVALRDAGAHAVKVGIGPGSICTTRVVCGVGVPQITAIYWAARALEGTVPVVADGGIRNSGDVPKALVAGADTVMLGAVLAGTEESPGEKIIYEGRQYVSYRGMGSLGAMREALASRERYGAINVSPDALVPQGVEGIVPYAGTVKQVMTQFCGGLRAALGYCGCRTIAELQRHGTFVRVTSAGVVEAHPHDVKITKEPPNYRL
ncbi:MAG: IMP dehydrogenase [Kiritimatiellae bacterium]|nr:IMP dehydrogenase [Kiritimatiellia bacterium]